MKIDLLLEAKEEALKFIKSIDEEMDKQKKISEKNKWIESHLASGNLYFGSGIATIKRRSMDLTRSLSKMRQG